MQTPSSPSAIAGQALIRRISIASSTPSTPPNPVEQGWGCQYAGPSSMLMEGSCGRKRTSRAALHFGSFCPAPQPAHESFSNIFCCASVSISASIDLNRVLQLNTFGVRSPSRPMFNNEYVLMNQKLLDACVCPLRNIVVELRHLPFTSN